jgi:hypothetical protein
VSRSTAGLFGFTLAVTVVVLASSRSVRARPTRAVSSCLTRTAASRANAAYAAATQRYSKEERGSVVHADLRHIAHDGVLLSALSVGNLRAARAEANRQLVNHVVRIRITRGSRILVDANPTSFDVAGSGMELYDRAGKDLGRLEITLQDVIGFIKLTHKLDYAEVVVRSSGGQVRSSLPAAAGLSLPPSGCETIGTHTYVVRSLHRISFSREPLTVSLLTSA